MQQGVKYFLFSFFFSSRNWVDNMQGCILLVAAWETDGLWPTHAHTHTQPSWINPISRRRRERHLSLPPLPPLLLYYSPSISSFFILRPTFFLSVVSFNCLPPSFPPFSHWDARTTFFFSSFHQIVSVCPCDINPRLQGGGLISFGSGCVYEPDASSRLGVKMFCLDFFSCRQCSDWFSLPSYLCYWSPDIFLTNFRPAHRWGTKAPRVR